MKNVTLRIDQSSTKDLTVITILSEDNLTTEDLSNILKGYTKSLDEGLQQCQKEQNTTAESPT